MRHDEVEDYILDDLIGEAPEFDESIDLGFEADTGGPDVGFGTEPQYIWEITAMRDHANEIIQRCWRYDERGLVKVVRHKPVETAETPVFTLLMTEAEPYVVRSATSKYGETEPIWEDAPEAGYFIVKPEERKYLWRYKAPTPMAEWRYYWLPEWIFPVREESFEYRLVLADGRVYEGTLEQIHSIGRLLRSLGTTKAKKQVLTKEEGWVLSEDAKELSKVIASQFRERHTSNLPDGTCYTYYDRDHVVHARLSPIIKRRVVKLDRMVTPRDVRELHECLDRLRELGDPEHVPDILETGELVSTPIQTGYDFQLRTMFKATERFTIRGAANMKGEVQEPRESLINRGDGVNVWVPDGVDDYNDFTGAHPHEVGLEDYPSPGDMDLRSLPMVQDIMPDVGEEPAFVRDMGLIMLKVDGKWKPVKARLLRDMAIPKGKWEETFSKANGWRWNHSYGLTIAQFKSALSWASRNGWAHHEVVMDHRFDVLKGAQWFRNKAGRKFCLATPFTDQDKQYRRWERYVWSDPLVPTIPEDVYMRRLRTKRGRPNIIWCAGGIHRTRGFIPWENHDLKGADLFHVQATMYFDDAIPAHVFGLRGVEGVRWNLMNDSACYFAGDHDHIIQYPIRMGCKSGPASMAPVEDMPLPKANVIDWDALPIIVDHPWVRKD